MKQLIHKKNVSPMYICLIAILAISLILAANHEITKKVVTVDVELDLYCYNIPQGYIHQFSLKKATVNNLIETSDNITRDYNSYRQLNDTNISYILFFTLNQSSSESIRWNYTISNIFDYQGHYKGHVSSSFNGTGKYKLTLELKAYYSKGEKYCNSKSTYIKIFN